MAIIKTTQATEAGQQGALPRRRRECEPAAATGRSMGSFTKKLSTERPQGLAAPLPGG